MDDALASLRLARSRNVGPRTYVRLLDRFGTPTRALEALPEIAAGAGLKSYEAAPLAAIEAEWAAATKAGARLLRLGEADYPEVLAEIPDPPPVLWARGEVALAARPCVAIVGARNASASGLRLAAMLATDLGVAGWVVVSGLARGIDRAAHTASLPTGTIAVLAGGVDTVYPPENAALAAQIAAQGLALSEAPMGEQPVARSFPRRNRIVSGLSAGVVLVEAAARSGSLITARMALEQGREAMAVPGSPLDARTEGCNALIREGAALIRSAEDVIEAIGTPRALRPQASLWLDRPAPRALAKAQEPVGDESAQRITTLLGPAPIAFDDLASAAGLSAAALSAVLLDLELDGRIERHPGDRIALAP